jgi:membrane protein DedA with SNARE-associated domain
MIDLSQLDVASPLSYLVAVGVPALDAILPILPSETAVIALGVATAGQADLRIAALVMLAAFGAFLGDNLAFLIGRRFGPVAERRFFSGARGARRRAWAEHALSSFGIRMIIVCRFLPGGRTAVTLTCGIIGYNRRKFVGATAVAGVIWAGYAFLTGRLGGKVFEDKPWAGLLLALGVALALTILTEVLRRTRPWRVLAWVRSRRERGGRHQSPDAGSRHPVSITPGHPDAADRQSATGESHR